MVMDLADGGLRVVASAPGFDPRNVAQSMDDPDSPLVNRAFGAYAVGSTFKLLVAAAALEQGVSPEQTYICNGWMDVNGQILNATSWRDMVKWYGAGNPPIPATAILFNWPNRSAPRI